MEVPLVYTTDVMLELHLGVTLGAGITARSLEYTLTLKYSSFIVIFNEKSVPLCQ